VYDIVQVIGSLTILAAFIGALTKRITNTSYPYLVMNAAGSTVLAVEASISAQWGFLLLEGVWAAASLYETLRRAIRPTPTPDGRLG
jgi:hypothetical protein